MRIFAQAVPLLVILAGSAGAAPDAGEPPVTKVYALKDAAGADAVALLRSLFIVVNQEQPYARFEFDERTNTLIVSASEQHQGRIARVLSLVDPRSPAGALPVAADGSPQPVQAYPIPRETGETAVDVLRSLFLVVNHRVAYARFGYDARTGLLFAIASPEHHRQISQVLGFLKDPATLAGEPPREAEAGPLIRVYPVQHADGERIVARLRGQFVVVNHEQAEVRFAFDSRTHSLIVIAAAGMHDRVRDAIAVYDYVLSGEQVQKHYQAAGGE